MEKLNAAVIGVGNMGKFHAKTYFEMDSVNLVSISDLNCELGENISNKYSCNFYKDYKEMIEKESIDLVSIVCPTIYHKDVAIYCIDKKINTLIEKPIADTLENAKIIMDRADKADVKVTVGHIERFNPAILKLKEIIDAGRIGEISSIIARRVGVCPPQIKDANVLIDLAVHDIDIISHILNELPKKVFINSNKAILSNRNDYADILLSYEKASAMIEVNWITPVKIRKLNVTGTKGYVELDYISQDITFFESNYKTGIDDFGDFIIKFSSPNKVEVGVEKGQPLKNELESFVNSIKNDVNPKVSLVEAFNALKIALESESKTK